MRVHFPLYRTPFRRDREKRNEFYGQLQMKYDTLDIGCGVDPQGDVNIDIENVCQTYGYRAPRNFIVASARHLPFRDKTFKRVIANHLLEHMEDGEIIATLKEIRRVADEAKFVVPNAYCIPMSWKYSWTSLGTNYRKLMLKYPHKQIFDEIMLRDALQLFFGKVRIEGEGTWIAIRPLDKLLAKLSKRIPFLGEVLVAHCK